VTAPLIVAIDGPAGVGKTTVSKLVARELNLPHIDTGAMYRAIGLAAKRRGIDTRDEAALEKLAEKTKIEFLPGEPARVLLDGEDVTSLIDRPRSAWPQAMSRRSPAFVACWSGFSRSSAGATEACSRGEISEPKSFRDTAQVLLTATPQVRANRRYKELQSKGISVPFETVLTEAITRDVQDSTRAESPLTIDDTYTVIDTSALTIPQVVDKIVKRVLGFLDAISRHR